MIKTFIFLFISIMIFNTIAILIPKKLNADKIDIFMIYAVSKCANWKKWTIIYVLVEGILFITGRIQYEHGLNFLCTTIFDTIMLPSLYLHYRDPIITYTDFTVITTFLLIYFKIPI